MPDRMMLGKFKAAALFKADACGAPVEGTDAGYFDCCPGAFAYTPNTTEGEAFERTCADGRPLVTIDGATTTNSWQLDLDLHGADPSVFTSFAGAVPITEGGEVIGWGLGPDSFGSASVLVWREILSTAGVCDPAGGAQQYLVTIFPWVDTITLTEEGTFGSQDAYLRLSGTARTGHQFGRGPIPLLAGDPDPVCLTDPVPSSLHVFNIETTVPWPDECGFVDVTACPAA